MRTDGGEQEEQGRALEEQRWQKNPVDKES